MTLLLASTSPRRRELLQRLGIDFEVRPSAVDERDPRPGEQPALYALSLAREKAGAVGRTTPGNWVLAADTVVAIDGEILNKPLDEADALRMLRTLSGRRHEVTSAVVLQRDGRRHEGWVTSPVVMPVIPEAEMRLYIATGEPMDKAGAYAVQGIGGRYVQTVEGCFNAVVGLPLCLVAELLVEAGLLEQEIAETCGNFCRPVRVA
jgi:nucleoside triphosphate pyrophosphatase